jgi:hypothetical protein
VEESEVQLEIQETQALRERAAVVFAEGRRVVADLRANQR